MVERLKPKGTLRLDHISLQEKGDNPYTKIDDTLGKARQLGKIDDGFGLPVNIQPFGGCQLSYREKLSTIGNRKLIVRRYYIGYIQFAFVRFDPDGVIVHLTGQDDPALGHKLAFDTLEPYLRSQLILA